MEFKSEHASEGSDANDASTEASSCMYKLGFQLTFNLIFLLKDDFRNAVLYKSIEEPRSSLLYTFCAFEESDK